jgi:hypothetical protein
MKTRTAYLRAEKFTISNGTVVHVDDAPQPFDWMLNKEGESGVWQTDNF